MSTFYASFDDRSQAELVLSHLLSRGVGPDGISVLSHQPLMQGTPNVAPPMESNAHLTDATVIVGRDDDPEPLLEDPQGPNPSPKNYLQESTIGTGISSDTTERTVSGVEEMQDGQSAAEDMTYPPELISQGDHEDDDVTRTLETGFPTPPPIIDDFQQSRQPDLTDMTQSLEAIPVDDFGVVVGGGALATAALDLSNGHAKEAGPLIAHLKDEGMTEEEANNFIEDFRNGKTLMAVAIVPGEIEAPYVEQLAENHGASYAMTCDAPRY